MRKNHKITLVVTAIMVSISMMLSITSYAATVGVDFIGVAGPGETQSQFKVFTHDASGGGTPSVFLETAQAPAETYTVSFKLKITTDIVAGTSVRIIYRAVNNEDSLVLFLASDGHLELHPLTNRDGEWGWRNSDDLSPATIGALEKDKVYDIVLKSSPDQLWLTVDDTVILDGFGTSATYNIQTPSITTFGVRSENAITVMSDFSMVNEPGGETVDIVGVAGPGADFGSYADFIQDSAAGYAESAFIETNAAPGETYTVKFNVKITSDIVDNTSIRIIYRAVDVYDSLLLFIMKDGHLELHPLTNKDGADWGWRNSDDLTPATISALEKNKEYSVEITSSPNQLWVKIDDTVILDGFETSADYNIQTPTVTTFGFRSDFAKIEVAKLAMTYEEQEATPTEEPASDPTDVPVESTPVSESDQVNTGDSSDIFVVVTLATLAMLLAAVLINRKKSIQN